MKTYSWYRIALTENEIAFNANEVAIVVVNGKTLSVGRHGDQLFAFAHRCPHAGGILADGWIDPRGNIVCPLHGYRFNLRTGINLTGEGYKLKHWPVEKRGDGIYVGMEEGLLSWLS